MKVSQAAVLVVPLVAVGFGLMNPIEISEWTVPWEESRPRDPYVAPDGRVWFVGQRADYAAVFDPSTEEFRRDDLPEGAGPHNLIVDDEGIVWYAGNRAAHIGRLDPATGEITQYPTPDPAARDPHTLIFGEGDDIWFSSQGANSIGRFDRTTGAVELVAVPTERARPYGIEMDSRGTIWVNLFGTNKLASIDPATMELTEHEMPAEDARGRRVAITDDDRVWYVDYARGYLGMLDPASGAFGEWRLPSGAESRPYAMTVDDRGRLWMVETGVEPNMMVGFDPATEQFFSSTPIESGGGAVRHMVFHEPTRAIWFGTDTNMLGRALVP